MSTTALDTQYRKVIPARFATRHNGSAVTCAACGTAIVLGDSFAATNGDGWHNYCGTCASSFPLFIRGLCSKLAGTSPTPEMVTAITAVTGAPTDRSAFLTALVLISGAVTAREITLTPAFAGTHDVNGTVIRIDAPAAGKWAGWFFVKDGSGNKLGSQRPGATYRGEAQDVLAALLAAGEPVAPVKAATAEISTGLYLHTDGTVHKLYMTRNDRMACKVLVNHGDHGTFEYVTGGTRTVREAVAAGTARLMSQDEATAFGRANDFCCNCGTHVDDDRSLAAGYGPTCAENNGWHYPTYAEAAVILRRPVLNKSNGLTTDPSGTVRRADGEIVRTARDLYRAHND